MCKVAGVTKVNDKNRDEVWMFMMMLSELMTPGNSDGLGYAAFNKEGKIFGEKWLNNKMAFMDISKIETDITAERMANIYSYFGDKVTRDDAQAIILHTRAATCGKGIKNTHPFINDEENPEVAIIHNGVIGNHYDLEKKYSTCDSEVIAHLYDKHGVKAGLSKIDEVTQRLWGWYTVLALSKDTNGRMYMDAFTDSPRLSSYFIPELDTRVYSTYADDIETVAKLFGFTLKDGKTMKPNTSQRIDVLTGDVVERHKCKEMKAPPKTSEYSGAGEVVWMEGDFSDDDFVKAFFEQTNRK